MYYHGSGHIGPFVHTSATHGKFGRILHEKKCSVSVTLLWSPYVYSPWHVCSLGAKWRRPRFISIVCWASPFCTQRTHMPSSGSFVTMYLVELHFGNGYMEIGLLISSLHERYSRVATRCPHSAEWWAHGD